MKQIDNLELEILHLQNDIYQVVKEGENSILFQGKYKECVSYLIKNTKTFKQTEQ